MKVHWTDTALGHLQAIHDYIARDSKRNAKRFVDRLTRKSQTVGRFPESGSIVPEFGSPEIREIFEQSYRIVYKILADRIDVVAVTHGARKRVIVKCCGRGELKKAAFLGRNWS